MSNAEKSLENTAFWTGTLILACVGSFLITIEVMGGNAESGTVEMQQKFEELFMKVFGTTVIEAKQNAALFGLGGVILFILGQRAFNETVKKNLS